MASNKKNLAAGIVANNPGTAGTSLVFETGYGQGMPETPFFLTLTPPNQLSTIGNSEIVEVTARTDDTMTMTREQKGTTAKDIAEGWVAVNGIYIEDLAGGGYVAQDEPPEDTSLLWYDTNDEGVTPDALTTMLDIVYPVGSEYTNYENGTNPATLLQMPWSTWVAVEGTVTVGLDPEDGDFDTALATGGEKEHTLSLPEIPEHSHTILVSNSSSSGWGYVQRRAASSDGGMNTSSAGGGEPHNNLQPYTVAYKWRRTA